MNKRDLSLIDYRLVKRFRRTLHHKSISPLGIDTEAYDTGECFMIATSEGDVFTPSEFPACLFSRKYRQQSFVAYNLKYDSGALLQHLPLNSLHELRNDGSTEFNGFKYRVIPYKMLKILRGRNSVTIYDLFTFFESSLDKASREYLGQGKIDMETKTFSKGYVKKHWSKISKYCLQDAKLVKDLAHTLIKKFETFDVYPRKLFSTAYISNQYFHSHCDFPNVNRFWLFHKRLLQFALWSYAGGKFEITEKGTGNFWEYDIVSAYPFEIANLVDVSTARVIHSKRYTKAAKYGFLDCEMNIPLDCYSPVPLMKKNVNFYPCGKIRKIITNFEYDYLKDKGVDIKILDGYWLVVDREVYPFKYEIERLVKLKTELKHTDKKIDYHIIKIFLNSLYGKFIQLIEKNGRYMAGNSFNPIYASIITAKVRIRVTEMQARYPEIIGVHTDSVIALKELQLGEQGDFGDFKPEVSGEGVLLGSGVYQIGDKIKFRGFNSSVPLLDLLDSKKSEVIIPVTRPITWIETVYRNMSKDNINKFVTIPKKLRVNFDTKRIWLDNWKCFKDVKKRNVISIPYLLDPLIGF